jgi:excinuclease ABC subunit A
MLRLRNVQVNNLNGIDLDIPPGQLVLFCGVSGSGKSSLAFDTIYAEGQRRYIECLSPKIRQFVAQLDKPAADLIEGIPPAIAVKAFRGRVDRKTTVGNATEIAEHLRMLFCELAEVKCPKCDQAVQKDTPESAAQRLVQLPERTRYQITFRPNATVDFATSLLTARANGFARAIVGGQTIDLSRPGQAQLDQDVAIDDIRIVVDRLASGQSDPNRIRESLEIAFQQGQGACEVLVSTLDSSASELGFKPRGTDVKIDGKSWNVLLFSITMTCGDCGETCPAATPQLFNHNHRVGQCNECNGHGFVDKFDRDRCPTCLGTRLIGNAIAFQIDGQNIAHLNQLPIGELENWVEGLKPSLIQHQSCSWLWTQIKSRIDYLRQVGLDYLTLDRPVRSLSAGEAQRVSLTSCLSSTLVNTLYVLDEPSVGMHASDTERLVAAIQKLNARENTVVVVDHDEHIIKNVSRIVEIGPGAGNDGGEIVFDGTPEAMIESGDTVTADFLAKRRGLGCNQENRRQPRGSLTLRGASGHNLKNIDVEFPLGCLTVVSGVSGSGKSSLVTNTLYGAVCQKKEVACDPPLPYQNVIGDSRFDEIVLVDRSPIGRSARSNPVTYVKAFDDIRRCFADTVDAKTRNLNVSKFSFNAAGGRCDKCEGAGRLTVDMQFMPDVSVTCDQCGGTRYRNEVLAVKYRGRNIADVLNLTVRSAFTFFRGQPKVQAKLRSLIDVGLEYIRLGQPANTLSSGESQRLKLGYYLNSSKSKRALFLMDEPTTGLHMADVTKLLDCFDTLLTVGHSLIVIEHNLRLIQSADWLIDLGPGPANNGGQVVASGPPEIVAKNKQSVTARHMHLLET